MPFLQEFAAKHFGNRNRLVWNQFRLAKVERVTYVSTSLPTSSLLSTSFMTCVCNWTVSCHWTIVFEKSQRLAGIAYEGFIQYDVSFSKKLLPFSVYLNNQQTNWTTVIYCLLYWLSCQCRECWILSLEWSMNTSSQSYLSNTGCWWHFG